MQASTQLISAGMHDISRADLTGNALDEDAFSVLLTGERLKT
jgi:hypothetical protein